MPPQVINRNWAVAVSPYTAAVVWMQGSEPEEHRRPVGGRIDVAFDDGGPDLSVGGGISVPRSFVVVRPRLWYLQSAVARGWTTALELICPEH